MGDVVQFTPRPALPDVPHFESYDDAMDYFRGTDTEMLKRMWDDPRDDGYHIHCDEIYWVMQERGEGDYVVV